MFFYVTGHGAGESDDPYYVLNDEDNSYLNESELTEKFEFINQKDAILVTFMDFCYGGDFMQDIMNEKRGVGVSVGKKERLQLVVIFHHIFGKL